MGVHVAAAVDAIVNFAGTFDPTSEQEGLKAACSKASSEKKPGRWQGHISFESKAAITPSMLTQKRLFVTIEVTQAERLSIRDIPCSFYGVSVFL